MSRSAQLWDTFYDGLRELALSFVDPATGFVSSSFAAEVPCPFCASSSWRPRIQKLGFRYVSCESCGLVYLNPQLSDEAILKMYNNDRVRKFFFEELLLPYVERDQQVEFHKRLKELQNLLGKNNGRILDIGCAAGNFLLIAGASGLSGEGLELNQQYVDFIRRERNVLVHQKKLEEMAYPPGCFDVVTLWDVLEHLPKPMELLREIARVVSPGGVVALSTINHECLNEKLLNEHWRYYQPPDHVCSFSPHLLERMLSQCGLRVVRIDHQYIFEVLQERYLRFFKPGIPETVLGNILNKGKKLMYAIATNVGQLIGRILNQGDIITVYARKL